MRLVVADASPLHYLVLTGYIELLPRLFEKILTPQRVCAELASSKAPATVQQWIAQPPAWLEIHPNPLREDINMRIDEGERAAIALAIIVNADLVLMDDREGVTTAREQGLAVTGTLGLLDLAARFALIDLEEALDRIKATNFHYRQGLLDELLARHKREM